MATRRMISVELITSDPFLDMPVSCRDLYIQLLVSADDDGFVSSPNRVRRCCGASADDLSLLAAKGFILRFESGVIVLTHWRMQNRVRKDMYKPTRFAFEAKQIIFDEDLQGYRFRTESDPLLVEVEQVKEIAAPKQKAQAKKAAKRKHSDINVDEHREIVEYLNTALGSNYKPDTQETCRHINGRLAEGYSVDDFKKVIDMQVSEWKDNPKMSKYLRPETLFCQSKFEAYFNAGAKAKPAISDDYAQAFDTLGDIWDE